MGTVGGSDSEFRRREAAAARAGNLPDFALGVHPSVPVKSVKELIALAKSNPGKLNYNSSASGGTTHLSMELFKNMAGVDIVHIPYTGGGPQVIAIMSGQVDLGFASITNTLPQVKAGKIKALAISSSGRSATTALPPPCVDAPPPRFAKPTA